MKFRFRQLIATVAVAAMSMAVIPNISGNDTVLADTVKSQSNTCLGTSKIHAPVEPENSFSAWSGSYVYFGSYDEKPIKFRVLAPSTTDYGSSTIFLDSDAVLFKKLFDENYSDWAGSYLNAYLNGEFLKSGTFTTQEQDAIAESKTDYLYYSELYVRLTGEKIFLLDICDISNGEYGYDYADSPSNESRKKGGVSWWLRTSYYGNAYHVGDQNYGTEGNNGKIVRSSEKYDKDVAPALNVDLSKVLFSTAIEGKLGEVGTSYKLTVLDDNLSVTAGSVSLSGTTFYCAASGNAEQLSLLITDGAWNESGSNILYCGAYTGSFDLSSIGLNAADWGSKYHVYLIGEDINSDKATDYASTPVELAKPSVTVTFNTNGNGTAPVTQTVVCGNKATKPADPTAAGYTFGGWYTDSACTKAYDFDSIVTADLILYAKWEEVKQTGGGFEDFVERLYVVALGRASEKDGKDYWCKLVGDGTLTGADCARFFLTSQEFKDRGLSDEEFLKVLYSTFFDRNAADDPDGFNFWMNSLKSVGKDTVVEGFINSPEWCNICADYGVKSGAPTAKATNASKNATAFATRLYTECLGREPEEGGLKYWSLGLTNLELTGSQAAHEFFYCQEFNDHGFDNKELITRMYKTFMGREPDTEGLNYWLGNMNNGMTKDQVFNSFVQSQEFTDICASYAITR